MGETIHYFKFVGFSIPTYSFFIVLGVLVGALTLIALKSRMEEDWDTSNHSFIIAGAALMGGALGAKLPIWIMNMRVLTELPPSWVAIFSGRTVLGGFIGGFLAIAVVKGLLKTKKRMGNQLAPAVAVGMAIGRLGCYFQGCCYGAPSTLPWARDFGDGVLRQPTQLYEVGFHLLAFFFMLGSSEHKREGGNLLALYFLSYFVFRFFQEFIRVNPEKIWGITVYQWICLFGIGLMAFKSRKSMTLKGADNG